MNHTVNMSEVFNSIDARKAQALATIDKYSTVDRAEASRIASLYDNCAKTSAKHLCDTASILQDQFQPNPTTRRAPLTMTEAISEYQYLRTQCQINPIDACTDAAQYSGVNVHALAAALRALNIDAARLSII